MAALKSVCMRGVLYDPDLAVGSLRGLWWMSEKLDGQRAMWVDGRLITRYGNAFVVPPEWLDRWIGGYTGRLDGELMCAGGLQRLREIVSRTVNIDVAGWMNEVTYAVFDAPVLGSVFNPEHSRITVTHTPVREWGEVLNALNEVVDRGGEGLMLRRDGTYWVGTVSRDLVKVKKSIIDTGVIICRTEGKGKHQGRVGSVQLLWNSRVVNCANFTDVERDWDVNMSRWPNGASVQFRYLELTRDGNPREARLIK